MKGITLNRKNITKVVGLGLVVLALVLVILATSFPSQSKKVLSYLGMTSSADVATDTCNNNAAPERYIRLVKNGQAYASADTVNYIETSSSGTGLVSLQVSSPTAGATVGPGGLYLCHKGPGENTYQNVSWFGSFGLVFSQNVNLTKGYHAYKTVGKVSLNGQDLISTSNIAIVKATTPGALAKPTILDVTYSNPEKTKVKIKWQDNSSRDGYIRFSSRKIDDSYGSINCYRASDQNTLRDTIQASNTTGIGGIYENEVNIVDGQKGFTAEAVPLDSDVGSGFNNILDPDGQCLESMPVIFMQSNDPQAYTYYQDFVVDYNNNRPDMTSYGLTAGGICDLTTAGEVFPSKKSLNEAKRVYIPKKWGSPSSPSDYTLSFYNGPNLTGSKKYDLHGGDRNGKLISEIRTALSGTIQSIKFANFTTYCMNSSMKLIDKDPSILSTTYDYSEDIGHVISVQTKHLWSEDPTKLVANSANDPFCNIPQARNSTNGKYFFQASNAPMSTAKSIYLPSGYNAKIWEGAYLSGATVKDITGTGVANLSGIVKLDRPFKSIQILNQETSCRPAPVSNLQLAPTGNTPTMGAGYIQYKINWQNNATNMSGFNYQVTYPAGGNMKTFPNPDLQRVSSVLVSISSPRTSDTIELKKGVAYKFYAKSFRKFTQLAGSPKLESVLFPATLAAGITVTP